MARQEGPGVPAPSMCEPIGGFDVISEDEWNAAREKLLAEEKALMKVKDRLVAKRRLLPVTNVDRNYKFIGTNGDRDLLGLFEGRRQLVVYRFFYAPDVENWPDGACSGCSLFADTVVHPAHLAARDTTLAFVTAAPIDKIESLRERMGWNHIPFYSLPDERFSRDFGVKELFGINVFIAIVGEQTLSQEPQDGTGSPRLLAFHEPHGLIMSIFCYSMPHPSRCTYHSCRIFEKWQDKPLTWCRPGRRRYPSLRNRIPTQRAQRDLIRPVLSKRITGDRTG